MMPRLDRDKLRRLGELMCHVSAGRLASRDALLPPTAELMASLRDDGSPAGAGRAVDRLISIAHDGLGGDIMAAMASCLLHASAGRVTLALPQTRASQ